MLLIIINGEREKLPRYDDLAWYVSPLRQCEQRRAVLHSDI